MIMASYELKYNFLAWYVHLKRIHLCYQLTPFKQTPSLVETAALDIEPRKLLLVIPKYRSVHINLDLPDAEISSRIIQSLSELTPDESVETRRDEETMRVLRLKRERDFDIEVAEAEWKIGSGVVVIHL